VISPSTTGSERLPTRPVIRILVAVKVLLIGLMVIGAVFPKVGGFAGKGMGYRLPVYVVPSLVVPVRWLRGKAWSVGLDIALTVPFLLDTLGNLFGWFDAWSSFDNVLHFVNWFVLVWGITTALDSGRHNARNLVWIAGTGIGAIAAIGWEIAEYRIMVAGVGNLHLTYADTLGDLAAGTAGGALGALLAVRYRPAWSNQRSKTGP
jgi:hypothetical protein